MAIRNGTSGDDELEGTRLADIIRGFDGDDELEGEGGDDTLLGGDDDDELDGDSGDDVLYGGNGNDDLDGGSGKDRLSGGAGRDELDGGRGNDRLFGGTGADIFEFEPGDGHDIIADWRSNDRIKFDDDFSFDSFSEAMDRATQVGDDVVFDVGSRSSIKVLDTDLDDFSAGDFLF